MDWRPNQRITTRGISLDEASLQSSARTAMPTVQSLMGSNKIGSPGKDSQAASGKPVPDVHRYLWMFQELNTKGIGKLNKAEAQIMFDRTAKLSPSELDAIWQLADVDKDGLLTFAEFASAMNLVERRKQDIWRAVDIDGPGRSQMQLGGGLPQPVSVPAMPISPMGNAAIPKSPASPAGNTVRYTLPVVTQGLSYPRSQAPMYISGPRNNETTGTAGVRSSSYNPVGSKSGSATYPMPGTMRLGMPRGYPNSGSVSLSPYMPLPTASIRSASHGSVSPTSVQLPLAAPNPITETPRMISAPKLPKSLPASWPMPKRMMAAPVQPFQPTLRQQANDARTSAARQVSASQASSSAGQLVRTLQTRVQEIMSPRAEAGQVGSAPRVIPAAASNGERECLDVPNGTTEQPSLADRLEVPTAALATELLVDSVTLPAAPIIEAGQVNGCTVLLEADGSQEVILDSLKDGSGVDGGLQQDSCDFSAPDEIPQPALNDPAVQMMAAELIDRRLILTTDTNGLNFENEEKEQKKEEQVEELYKKDAHDSTWSKLYNEFNGKLETGCYEGPPARPVEGPPALAVLGEREPTPPPAVLEVPATSGLEVEEAWVAPPMQLEQVLLQEEVPRVQEVQASVIEMPAAPEVNFSMREMPAAPEVQPSVIEPPVPIQEDVPPGQVSETVEVLRRLRENFSEYKPAGAPEALLRFGEDSKDKAPFKVEAVGEQEAREMIGEECQSVIDRWSNRESQAKNIGNSDEAVGLWEPRAKSIGYTYEAVQAPTTQSLRSTAASSSDASLSRVATLLEQTAPAPVLGKTFQAPLAEPTQELVSAEIESQLLASAVPPEVLETYVAKPTQFSGEVPVLHVSTDPPPRCVAFPNVSPRPHEEVRPLSKTMPAAFQDATTFYNRLWQNALNLARSDAFSEWFDTGGMDFHPRSRLGTTVSTALPKPSELNVDRIREYMWRCKARLDDVFQEDEELMRLETWQLSKWASIIVVMKKIMNSEGWKEVVRMHLQEEFEPRSRKRTTMGPNQQLEPSDVSVVLGDVSRRLADASLRFGKAPSLEEQLSQACPEKITRTMTKILEDVDWKHLHDEST